MSEMTEEQFLSLTPATSGGASQQTFVAPVDISPLAAKQTLASRVNGAPVSPVGKAAATAYTKAQSLKSTGDKRQDAYWDWQMSGLSADDYAARTQDDYATALRSYQAGQEALGTQKSKLDMWDISGMYSPWDYTPEAKRELEDYIAGLEKEIGSLRWRSDKAKTSADAFAGILDEQKRAEEIETLMQNRMGEFGSYAGIYNNSTDNVKYLEGKLKEYSELLSAANGDGYDELVQVELAGGGHTWQYQTDEEKRDAAVKEYTDKMTEISRQLDLERAFNNYARGMLTEDEGAQNRIASAQEAVAAADEQILRDYAGQAAASTDYMSRVYSDSELTPEAYAQELLSDRRPNDQWTQKEKDTFYLIYTEQGEDAASRYAVGLNKTIREENRNSMTAGWAEWGRSQDMSKEARASRSTGDNIAAVPENALRGTLALLGNVATAPVHLFNWLDNIYQYNQRGGYYAGNEIPRMTDYTGAAFEARANALNQSYGTINENVPVLGDKGFGDLYQLVESVVESLVYAGGGAKAFAQGVGEAAANGSAKAATYLLFFGQAADASYQEAIDRGYSHEQATVASFFAGLAEAAGEEFSVEHLLDDSTILTKGFGKYILEQSLVEGSEEGLTDVLDLFGDELAAKLTDNISGMKRDILNLTNQGVDYEDAKRQVWTKFAEDAAFDILGGMFSGGVSGTVMGGPQAYQQYKAENKVLDSAYQQLKETPTTERRRADRAILERLSTDAGFAREAMSGGGEDNLGKPAVKADVDAAMRALRGEKTETSRARELMNANRSAVVDAVQQQIEGRGEDVIGEARSLANAVVADARGEGLSENQKKLAERNRALFDTLKQELTGEKRAKWARDVILYGRKAITGGAGEDAIRQAQDMHGAVTNARTVMTAEADGESGTIVGVVKGEDGNVAGYQVKTESGVKEITQQEAGLNQAQQIVAEALTGGEYAEEKLANLQDGQNAAAYVEDFDYVAEVMGNSSLYENAEEAWEEVGDSTDLTRGQFDAAFEAGRQHRDSAPKTAFKERGSGEVSFEAYNDGTTEYAAPSEADVKAFRETAKFDVLQRIAKAAGVDLVFFKADSKVNGEYRQGKVFINMDAAPGSRAELGSYVMQTAAHELTHYLREKDPARYAELKDFVVRRLIETGKLENGKTLKELIRDKQALYERAGQSLTVDGVIEEVVADACEMVLNNEKMLARLEKDNAKLARSFRDYMRSFLRKIRKAFTGAEATHAEAKAMQGVMRDLAKVWGEGVFGEGEAATQANENAAQESGGKYAIKEIGDTGKYYVQASRQVLYGDDSDAWGEQLTRYINREIRRGNDVALSTADGDILKLTQTTAEKGAFRNVWYDKNGRAHVYTDEEYRAKLNAEAHIDELTTISVDKSPARPNKPDYNNLHGDFAKNGWRYRNAHFMDFDGTYYKLTISAAYGNDGKVVYNVANMDKDTFPSVTGSSSIKAGAQGGKVSSDDSIRQGKKSVKEESGRFSLQDEEAVSDRELLANTLASLAQNPAEERRLAQYKNRLDEFYETRDKLAEVENELRQARLVGDKKRIEEKQRERAKLSAKLTRIDSYLLDLQATKPLRELLNRAKADARTRTRTLARERQSKTALRNQIRRLHGEMSNDLLDPRKGHYVPERLRKPIAELLKSVNTDSGRSQRMKDAIERLNMEYRKLAEGGDKIAEGGDDSKIAEGGDGSFVFDQTVADMLQKLNDLLIEKGSETSIYDMNRDELRLVLNTMRALNHTVRTAVKMVNYETERNAFQISKGMMEETRRAAPKGVRAAFSRYFFATGRNDVVFRRLGGYRKGGMWEMMADMLDKAQLRQSQLQMEGSRIFEELMRDTKALDRMTSTRDTDLLDIGLRDEDGNSVKVTRDIALKLYLDTLNAENSRHLAYGGLTVPDLRRYYKGKAKKSYGRGSVRVMGYGEELSRLSYELRHAETAEEQAEIEERARDAEARAEQWINDMRRSIYDQLGDYEKAWITAAQRFFNDFSQRTLNETTRAVYGFDRATVENYVPIHTDPAYRQASFEGISRDISLENAGFMKERILNAKNPMLAEGLVDVVAMQIDNVAKYAAMMPAVRNFEKVYGKSLPGFTSSVQAEVRTKFDENAVKYIDNIMTDLTSPRRTEGGLLGEFADRLRGNLAAASLTLNPRVAMGQAASYPTAAAEIGWGPLVKAFGMGANAVRNEEARQEIAKWSPLYWYRMQGFYDTEAGDLRGSRTAMAKISNRLGFLTNWIQYMDGATVGRLWYAAKAYVQEQNPELENGSDAFMEKTAEVFNRIVERTQPNYTTLQRPDILRNPNAIVKQLTMFMTQRLQNLNILYDAIGSYNAAVRDRRDGKNGVTEKDVKDAQVKLTRAVTSQVAAAAAITAFKFLADALLYSMKAYRDDDDELTKESVLKKLLLNMGESAASNFLWGAELYDAASKVITGDKYYGVSLNGFESFTDALNTLVKTLQYATSDDKSREKTLEQLGYLVKNGGQLFGVPVTNIGKLISAVTNRVKDAQAGNGFLSYESEVKDTDERRARLLYRALTEGDEEAARRQYEAFGEKADANKALQKHIREQYKAGNMSDEEARKALQEYADMSRYDSEVSIGRLKLEVDHGIQYDELREQYVAGEISREEAIDWQVEYGSEKRHNVEKEVRRWDCEKETGYEYDKLQDYVAAGDITEDQAVEYRVKYGGQEEPDAISDVAKWMCEIETGIPYDSIQEYYANGWIDRETLIEDYKQYGLMDDELAERVANKRDFIGLDYDLNDISLSASDDYYKYAAGLGVDKHLYYDAWKQGNAIHADYNSNGKAIAYSAMDKKLRYIDTLPLDNEQKTAIALCYGISSKNISSRAPWKKR